MTTIKINVTLHARTDHAILVSDGKRQVEDEILETTGPMGLMTTTAIVVPAWVAQEKGLQQTHQDTDTLDMFGATP